MDIETKKQRALEASRRWRAKNPGYWRAGDPSRQKEARRRYRERNADKIRGQNREAQRRYTELPAPTRPAPSTCECCGGPPGKRALHLDHDHSTGEFRGWLCRACNTAIGALGDNAAGVRNALNYLERLV